VEQLERRDVPSALSVADVIVREGPTATGILDPIGAASVGLNGIRGITFDTGPTDAHYGDLFVTGYLSHSVARFDWASQTYQPFVAPNNGGLQEARGIAVGPDGNVYVSDFSQNVILRYDGSTGAPLPAAGQSGAVFIPAGALSGGNIAFGPDGNVYVGNANLNQILEYQGPAGPSPGAFVKVFASITNASPMGWLTFGPDGNLYVSLQGGQVNRYDGSTGAPVGTGVFVPQGSGGLIQARGIVFDPAGTNMYVIEDLTGTINNSGAPSGPMGQVLR
jgi:glucose/arabinose dehydrogenase